MEAVFRVGTVVDDTYEIRATLGAGGMGEVYDALDRSLNRRVALKVVRPGIAPDYLLREGRALAAIHHPGVVTVHAMGMHANVPYLVLERVRGLALDRMMDDRLERGERFTVFEALDLLVSIADALHVVHKAGLVHRDVKPANVMLAPGGRVVLMDFGLVLPDADRAGHRSVAGSLPFMAPEALTGDLTEGAAHLVDVYALGVVGFELLTGREPFEGNDPNAVYRAKTRMPEPRVTTFRPDVPEPVADAISQLMAADASDRPQGAEAALWLLRNVRERVKTKGAWKPLSVLVVDDDPDMRQALGTYVRAAVAGAEVESTGEGREALRAVRRHVPDLLLLDLDLPDINGLEVCMLLRGMELGEACTIVSVSARASKADVELLQMLGVQALEKGPQLMGEVMRLARAKRKEE